MSGPLATLRKLAHFQRHHRKATTVFPRTPRFDGRIQGQQISLIGDIVNNADALGNILHGLNRTQYGSIAFLHIGAGLPGNGLRQTSVLIVAGNRS